MMKKKLFFFLSFLYTCNLFSKDLEIVKIFKFNEPIQYYEEYDTNEGHACGFTNFFVMDNVFVFTDNPTYKIYKCDLKDTSVLYNPQNLYSSFKYYKTNDFFLFAENDDLYLYTNLFNLEKEDYRIKRERDWSYFPGGFYYTDSKLFMQTANDELVYWDLLDNGNIIFRGLVNEKIEAEYGIQLIGNKFYFGETSVSVNRPPLYWENWNKVSIQTEKYKSLIFQENFSYLGTDLNGISYYFTYPGISEMDYRTHPEVTFKLAIAVLDSWSRNAYVIDLPDGSLNPSRNEKGLIAIQAECIDEKGNVYFSDCNKEKQQYEIKKLNNEWLKQFDFFNREIGRMNSNHIELYKAPSRESGFDGYNFDHEYLWILEHGKEWSKVRKVDGREGWVENKYISFTDEQRKNKEDIYSPVFNSKIAKNQIMTVSENLRLRKTELSSSDIITTMKAGTKVKIVELGRIEQIDNRTEYWVKVEVLAGGKDRNDNPISGTIGWCFGGYLK